MMTGKRLRRLMAMAAVAAALAAPGAAAAATPVDQGCPAKGFEYVTVEQAESEGYLVAALVDGEGNEDGAVCRRALGKGVLKDFPDRPDPIYLFRDNNLPTAGD